MVGLIGLVKRGPPAMGLAQEQQPVLELPLAFVQLMDKQISSVKKTHGGYCNAATVML